MKIGFSYSASSFVALAAALAAAPVLAQAGAADPQVDTGGMIGDIVVTAQRREERNQDVPIAITAFSNEALKQQNVTSGQDLNGVVPSLQVSTNGQATRGAEGYTFRGVSPTYLGGSSVVVYLAEVPLPQAFSTNQQGGPGNYLDLENVQALAGPQGTLFGRNTTGGAVLLVPHKPTNDLGGYVEASYGNYDYVGLEGVLNVPIVDDKLLVRVAGSYQDRDGFTKDLLWNKDRDDLHYYTGRLSILFKPSERLTNYLMAYGTHSSTNGTTYIHDRFNIPFLQNYPSPIPSCTGSCDFYVNLSNATRALGVRQVRLSVDAFDRTDTAGIINKTSFEISNELTLNNIVSYQHLKQNFATDEDGTPLQAGDIGTTNFPDGPVEGIPGTGYFNEAPYGPREDHSQYTEELQLQGSFLDNQLTMTVGGFYFRSSPSTQKLAQVFLCPAADTGTCGPVTQTYQVGSRSKALYGQATLDLGAFSTALSSLRLTGGFRYTWERVQGRSSYYALTPFGPYCVAKGILGTTPDDCEQSASLSYKAPTWTFGVDYKPLSNALLFAKISRGFKAGGYNAFSVRPETRTFQPEKVTSYEAGIKSDWRLGSIPLRLNVTGYYTDYASIQLGSSDTNASGGIGSRIIPASAKIKGVEAEASFRPFPALEIGGNLSYTDVEREEAVTPVDTVDCTGPVPAGGTISNRCVSGAVPKWTYTIRGSLDLPMPENWGDLSLYANYTHVGAMDYIDTSVDPAGHFDAYGLLNVSANWRNIGRSNIDVSLFATNLTNSLYKISTGALYSCCAFSSNIWGAPRMYGARVRYNFGG